MGGAIVGFDGSAVGWLWVTHFVQGGEDWAGFLGAEEDTTCFGFGCGGGYAGQSFDHYVEWAVGLGKGRGTGRSVGEGEECCTSAHST